MCVTGKANARGEAHRVESLPAIAYGARVFGNMPVRLSIDEKCSSPPDAAVQRRALLPALGISPTVLQFPEEKLPAAYCHR